MRFVLVLCAELVDKMRMSQHYRIINVHIRRKLSVLCTCLFGVKLPQDDRKKIETCRSISGLYVTVRILISVHFFGVNFHIFKCVNITFPTPAFFSPVPRKVQSFKIRNIIRVNTNKKVLGHDDVYIRT